MVIPALHASTTELSKKVWACEETFALETLGL
jgi:hypothetical protein